MFQSLVWQNEKYFWLFLLVLVLLVILILYAHFYKKVSKEFGRKEVILQLMPLASKAKKIWKSLLLIFIIAILIFALARPQIGTEKSYRKVKASEIVLVIDVSNSMLARSNPNALSRLDKVKLAVNYLINRVKADQLALIIFSSDAAMVMPMSNDYEVLKMYVNNLNTTYFSSQGTAVGTALDMAMNAFTDKKDINKAIILFSDGENLEGQVSEQIQRAKQEKIRIYTVGVGSERGNPIYLPNGKMLEYKGQVVISKQVRDFLVKLATQTKGLYVNIDNNQTNVKVVYQDIYKHATGKVSTYSRYEEVYDYFVAIALILLILQIFMLERKNRFLRKIKLFER